MGLVIILDFECALATCFALNAQLLPQYMFVFLVQELKLPTNPSFTSGERGSHVWLP